VFLFLAETFPRQAHYKSITTRQLDDAAEIVVRGVDSMDRSVAIETTYRLEAGARHLLLHTTVTNRGRKTLPAYGLGDVIQWGHAERFLPGQGQRAKGRMKLPWVAGAGRTTSMLYGIKDGPVDGIHGGTWSDFVVSKPDLEPGKPVSFERFIAVGSDSGLASAYENAWQLLGPTRPGRVQGQVVETKTGAPVQALVLAILNDGPVTTFATDESGRFAGSLPAGRYNLTILARERAPVRVVPVDVREAGVSPPVRIEATAPAALHVDIDTVDGPCPGKVILEGLDTTLDPELGPAFAASGAGNTAVTLDGKLDLRLPPGRYRVTCSRGIEFDIAEDEITLPPLAPGAAPMRHACRLRRAVETPGRVSFDLHTHASPSYDAAISLPDRVTANLAEGLEGFVGSDHNVITDFAATVAELGVRDRIVPIAGDEATVEGLGHFNGYPLVERKNLRNGGAPEVYGLTAAQVFQRLRALPGGDRVVQVNHPRSGREGYFDQIKFDPTQAAYPNGFAPGFDAIEVVNGKRIGELPAVLADYFALLQRGHKYTAVGNSDSHAVFGQEAGYPRNLIRLGTDDPAKVKPAMVVRALKVTRDVVVTNGPILDVDVGGVGPGGRAKVADLDHVPVHVRIQAAPWIDVDRIEMYVDGKAAPTVSVPTSRDQVRFDATLPVPARAGSFIVVTARGSKSLQPVVSSPDRKPIPPVAVANPIWIEKGKPPTGKRTR